MCIRCTNWNKHCQELVLVVFLFWFTINLTDLQINSTHIQVQNLQKLWLPCELALKPLTRTAALGWYLQLQHTIWLNNPWHPLYWDNLVAYENAHHSYFLKVFIWFYPNRSMLRCQKNPISDALPTASILKNLWLEKYWTVKVTRQQSPSSKFLLETASFGMSFDEHLRDHFILFIHIFTSFKP